MKYPASFECPPAPPRETARIRQALSVRVDAGLVRAFYEACKRYELRHSEMMEIILWNALEKPPLSYQPESGASKEDSGKPE
ncbi:hypothetical protein [Desulfomonile tiedjei]|uniref:CopG family transcriptional regulator n=1 Tax=Desulfomonile tiedjei (strain ATCC 49306 / DSM 6799 / DCB-1) TaxID=706587 RepID=I4C1M1_DESTA|nr:hypothetical protein [Desulfomonile tiedjei]AFM23462.1 hypothetical protein Desti_0736 [Desulfomonile tiedjei DSM 6799]